MKAAAYKERSLFMKYDHRVTGQVIGTLRVQRGLSQSKLATKAGLARSHLAMIECGHKSASVETLWELACALGMRISSLMCLVEDRMQQMEE